MAIAPRDLAENAALAVIGGPAFAPVLSLLERLRGGAHLLRVLTYHRVGHPESTPDLDPGIVSATPEQFTEQLDFLARAYRVVSLEAVLSALRGGPPLPTGAVLITFDDAYEDFATVAWPMLRARGLPVTLFVPTAFPDAAERSFWWDRLHQTLTHAAGREGVETPLGRLNLGTPAKATDASVKLKACLKSLPHVEAMEWCGRMARELGSPPTRNPVLGWEALRKLAAEGVTLCPHTRTHPLLERIPAQEAIDEAVGSLVDLQREIGPTHPVLAYPAGSVDACLAANIREAGFTLGFTTAHGVNDLRAADPLRLRRINVGRRTSLGVLRTRLLAGSTALNRFRPFPA